MLTVFSTSSLRDFSIWSERLFLWFLCWLKTTKIKQTMRVCLKFELLLFTAVIHWVQFDCSNLNSMGCNVLSCFRIFLIEQKHHFFLTVEDYSWFSFFYISSFLMLQKHFFLLTTTIILWWPTCLFFSSNFSSLCNHLLNYWCQQLWGLQKIRKLEQFFVTFCCQNTHQNRASAFSLCRSLYRSPHQILHQIRSTNEEKHPSIFFTRYIPFGVTELTLSSSVWYWNYISPLQDVVSAMEAGLDVGNIPANLSTRWDMASAFFFCGTIITTIGRCSRSTLELLKGCIWETTSAK